MKSLLGEGAKVNEEEWFRRMLQDFNINQILLGIRGAAMGYDIEPMYHMYPLDEAMMQYRRRITRDFQRDSLRKAFVQFSRGMQTARVLEHKSVYADSGQQKGKWHSDALYYYCDAIEGLKERLDEEKELSAPLEAVRKELSEFCGTEPYAQARQLGKEINQYFSEHTFSLTIQPNRFIVRECAAGGRETCEEGERGAWCKVWNENSCGVDSGFSDDKTALVEDAVISFVRRKYPDIFRKIKELQKTKMDERFFQLEQEAQFYLSFFRYIHPFEEKGTVFTMPEDSENFALWGGTDLALASKLIRSGGHVVANDIGLREGEKFIVITGPNGGGKTTCARMAGIVLYFSAMGLLVPAQKAEVPFYSRILSHFSVEESEETGRGKLMEELQRLLPVLRSEEGRQFVVLNELFTTAATKDAEEMGRRVMELLCTHQCEGIYVTHIQALARLGEGIVSMIAELCEDHRTRSYKIVRRMAEEEEYEDSMIERYHLTYEQIREVLADAD